MAMLTKNKGLIIILSAPSGGGKTSISKKLLEQDHQLSLSVSATTRAPRPGEIDSVHYFFMETSEFNQKLQSHQLLEHAEIYGNLYGTPRRAVEVKLEKDLDVLFDIDSQGAYQIMEKVSDQVISIFITPPNLEVLATRLRARAQDSEETINQRLQLAQEEITQAKHYDYVVINDNFDRALAEIQEIITQERRARGNK